MDPKIVRSIISSYANVISKKTKRSTTVDYDYDYGRIIIQVREYMFVFIPPEKYFDNDISSFEYIIVENIIRKGLSILTNTFIIERAINFENQNHILRQILQLIKY